MLRKAVILFMALVMAFPAFAGAEEEALFPACGEQELWGYINAKGEWVIEPQFDSAGDFECGKYAVAGVEFCDGIIDRKGNWVVEPCYSIEELPNYGDEPEDILWLVKDEEELPDGSHELAGEGFFDVESGYFSGIHKNWTVASYSESDLIPVRDCSGAYGENNLGYINRRTGEQVIPYQYGTAPEWGVFHEGVAEASYDGESDEDGDVLWHLIDDQGNEIPLDEGLRLVGGGAHCGRILVQDVKTDLFGYVDTKGKLVIPAVYLDAASFRKDRALVQFDEYGAALIDPDGNEIVRNDQISYCGYYECGYARVQYKDNRRTWDGWLSQDGRLIRKVSGDAMPIREDRFWESAWEEDYWYLTNEEGQVLSANYKQDSFNYVSFRVADGRICVQNKDDLWGYVNEDGQEVIPCQWDEAQIFRNGLAYVEQEDLSAYIDTEGKIVFSWINE